MGSRPGGDRGDIVIGWLTRVIVGLALAAVVVFDGVSVGVTHLNASDDAAAAAQAANDAYRAGGTVQAAITAAQTYASEHSDTVAASAVQIAPDGTVRLLLHKQASTMLLGRIGPLRSLTQVTASGTASSPGP